MTRYIDKIFKQKLANQSVPVSDDLWDKIEARLPKQKKRQPYGFIFALVLIPLIALVSSYYIWYNVASSPIDVASLSVEVNPNKSVVKIYNSSILEKTVNEDSHISNELDHNNLSSAKLHPQSKSLEHESNPHPFVKAKTAIGLLQNVQKNITTSLSATSSTINVKETTLETPSTILANIVDINTASTDIQLEKIKNLASFSENRNLNHIYALGKITAPNTLISGSTTEKLKQRSRGLASAVKRRLVEKEPSKACPFGIENQQKSVDVYFSSDFNNRNLEAFDIKDQRLADLRNRTEYSSYSYSAGVRFGYNVSYRWNIHTGLNFSQIKENFKYEDPESSQTRLITIKDYIYQNGKIVDSVVTQQVVNVPGTMQYDVMNTYRTVDVPIIARYVLMANSHLSISGTAGTLINISMSQRGMILNEAISGADDISSNAPKGKQIFRNQLGLSPVFGLSLALHLTNKIDFLLEPNYKFQAQSITKGDYPLSQKYSTYSISTGIRYNF